MEITFPTAKNLLGLRAAMSSTRATRIIRSDRLDFNFAVGFMVGSYSSIRTFTLFLALLSFCQALTEMAAMMMAPIVTLYQ